MVNNKKGGRSEMYRKSVSFLSIFLICTLAVLMACDGRNINGSNTYNKNRLIVAMEGDAVSLDPHLSNVTISSQFSVQMFETLVQLDAVTGEVFGVLAESWERYDDYSYIFNLKQDVYFHDGQQMTAEDVAFSLERAASKPAVAAIMKDFDPDSVEIIDAFTVRIGTLEPFAPFLNNIAHPAASILSKYSFELLGEQGFGQNPVGTGPFKFYEREMGDYVEFRRFDDYHGELPTFEELQLRAVTLPDTRGLLLETGEVDVSFIGPTQISRIEKEPDLNLARLENYQTFYMGMNTNRIDDVRVRQAISYAIDVETIHSTIMYGVGELSTSPLGGNVFGAKTDLPPIAYDPEYARQLLEEANFDFSQTFTIATNEFPERLELAQVISAQLGQIGITANVVPLENPIFIEETSNGYHDLFILAWTTVTGDADYGLLPLFHSSNHGAPGNRTFFNHPRADELLELGRNTFDPVERIRYYNEVQQIIHDEAPFLLLATGELKLGARSGVNGLLESMGPANHVRFKYMTFD